MSSRNPPHNADPYGTLVLYSLVALMLVALVLMLQPKWTGPLIVWEVVEATCYESVHPLITTKAKSCAVGAVGSVEAIENGNQNGWGEDKNLYWVCRCPTGAVAKAAFVEPDDEIIVGVTVIMEHY